MGTSSHGENDREGRLVLVPSIIIHVFYANQYLFLCQLEELIGRPYVDVLHHGKHDLHLDETVSDSNFPGVREDLTGFDVFDRDVVTPWWIAELSEVLDSKPPRAPEQIVHAVVRSIAIQVDRGVELGVERRKKRISDENCHRPLVEFLVSSHPYDLNPHRIESWGDQSIVAIASYLTFATDGVVRKRRNLEPLFHEGYSFLLS